MWIILHEMWINMASLKYIIPDYKNPAEEIKWMSDERIQSVAHSSIQHEDKFKEQLNSVWNCVWKNSCVFSYTFQYRIDRYVRKHNKVEEKAKSVEKRTNKSMILSDIKFQKTLSILWRREQRYYSMKSRQTGTLLYC